MFSQNSLPPCLSRCPKQRHRAKSFHYRFWYPEACVREHLFTCWREEKRCESEEAATLTAERSEEEREGQRGGADGGEELVGKAT